MVCSLPLASGAGIGLSVPPFQGTASPWLEPSESGM
jgi:hypothetical protein